MLDFRTTWSWAAVWMLAGSLVVAPAEAAQPEQKRPANRPAGLLDIPKVSKDQVICFALYTVDDGVLKLTAQLYPLDEDDPRTVRLEVKLDGAWNSKPRALGTLRERCESSLPAFASSSMSPHVTLPRSHDSPADLGDLRSRPASRRIRPNNPKGRGISDDPGDGWPATR